MPLFDSLLSLIPSWSPSRRRSNPPAPSRPPPSDDISDSRLRTQSSGDSVEFLGRSPNKEEASGFESCLSDRNPSYAEGSISSPKPPAVRQLRRPPRMRFGMSVLQEGRRPTDRQSDTKDDERRLFPHFSDGPNPVLIKPGETTTKNKSLKSLNPFRPWDTISGKRKESGPVPARGKSKHQTYGANRSRLEDAREHDSERPAKRRRHDQESASGRRVHLDNDDAAGKATSSPDSGKRSTKKKGPRKFPGALGEHRYVDPNSGVNWLQDRPNRQNYSSEGETDEQFTEIAANQRRLSVEQADAGLGRDSKPDVFQSVEVLVPRGSARGKGESQSPSLQAQFVASDGSQRNSEMKPSGRRRSSDSPDELQGSITVNPSQSPTVRRSKGDVSGAERWAGFPSGVSSPSDIQPTNFTSRQSNRSKPKSKKENLEHSQFDAVFVRVGLSSPLGPSNGPLEIRVDNKHIEVTEPTGRQRSIPLEKFIRLLQGENPSGKVRLQMCRTELGDWMDIELSSQDEKTRFTSLLRDRITVVDKPSQWMDNVFEKATHHLANGSKRPSETSPVAEKSPGPRVEGRKRPKLSDSLQDDYGKTNSGDYLSHPPRKSVRNSRLGTHSHSTSKPDSILGFEIPVKTYKPPSSPLRETRSMLRNQSLEPIVCDDDDDEVNWESTPDPPSGKWSKPLVYPRLGRNTAEVHAQDRERLRGSEFLNDNLIGFYIRFLEEHLNRTNKEVARRVYFFNSFFFTAITNTQRGQRGINYKSVEKWTRNVDLFSYDYIVVPINEAAHWYVAIICNLPSLQSSSGTEPQNESEAGKSASRPTSESQEIPETPEPSQEPVDAIPQNQDSGPKEEVARYSLATMSLSDNADPAVNDPKRNSTADDDWPEFAENPTSSPAKFSSSADKADTPKGSQATPARAVAASQKGKKQKRKPVPPRQKYDVRQPIVITFDSLDMGRSPTISTLREYLYEEAMSKKGVEIDTKRIKGMTARQIPLQRNFSDCGLYLLAYLEKFIQNPDEFVTKLLRKEMDTKSDWPLLKSGLLRRRLRNFLDDLYDEQEQIGSQKDSAEPTMVDRQPITYLLGPDPERNSSQQSPSGGPSKKQTGTKSRDGTPKAECDREQEKPKDKKASKEQASARAKDDDEKADEIVEVPDSQDGGKATRSAQGHKHSKTSDRQKDALTVVHEDGSDQAGNPDPEDTQDSIIEVQVTGTPPLEPAPKAQETQKSPRTPKSKD